MAGEIFALALLGGGAIGVVAVILVGRFDRPVRKDR